MVPKCELGELIYISIRDLINDDDIYDETQSEVYKPSTCLKCTTYELMKKTIIIQIHYINKIKLKKKTNK